MSKNKTVREREPKIDAMSQRRINLSENLFDELSSVMNEIHQSTHSKRFWFMVVEEHVRAMISRKKLLDKHVLNKNPDLYPTNSYTFPSTKDKFRKWAVNSVKYFLTRSNKKKINELLAKRNKFGIGFPDLPVLSEEKIGVDLPTYIPLIVGFGDRSKRKKVNEISKRYKDPFLINTILQLPRLYVEHFQPLYDKVRLIQPEKKKFLVHGLMKFSFTQLIIAKYVERGSELIWYQHGAGYGEIETKYSRYLEYSVADKFITWGWQLNKKDVPGEAYRLEEFSREYFKRPNAETVYDLLICFPDMNGKKRNRLIEISKQILLNLDGNKYKRILARPRPPHKKHSHAQLLDFIEDDRVDISDGLTSIINEMKSSSLVLQMDVPATNFLECIYIDYPTVGILNNPAPTKLIEPFYKYFSQQGLLHYNTESLVKHLNQMELSNWWRKITENTEYLAFKKTFTRKVHDPNM